MTHSNVVWRIYRWHDSFIRDMTHSCVTWLIYMWHDSFICVTWLIYMWHDLHTCEHDLLTCVWHDSFICVTWLIHMCVMTDSYVWHYLFKCDMTHSCVSFMCESCHTWRSHTWMSHVTHGWMGHVTYMNQSCHTCKWVMAHIWLIYALRMNRSCHTWVMSHMKDARHILVWVTCTFLHISMSHTYVLENVRFGPTSLMCDVTHVWHESFMFVTWLSPTCDMTHLHGHDSLTRLIHMSHVTPSCVTWLIDTTHSYESHDFFMCDMTHIWVTRVTYVYMTHTNMWRDSSIHRA